MTIRPNPEDTTVQAEAIGGYFPRLTSSRAKDAADLLEDATSLADEENSRQDPEPLAG